MRISINKSPVIRPTFKCNQCKGQNISELEHLVYLFDDDDKLVYVTFTCTECMEHPNLENEVISQYITDKL